MKRYTVAAFRKELRQALDEAEQGIAVVVVRAGTAFRLVREAEGPKRKPAKALIEVDDELLENGWSWRWAPGAGIELQVGSQARSGQRRRSGKR
jgi:hypothetical protein